MRIIIIMVTWMAWKSNLMADDIVSVLPFISALTSLGNATT